jgi:hypothetical protein
MKREGDGMKSKFLEKKQKRQKNQEMAVRTPVAPGEAEENRQFLPRHILVSTALQEREYEIKAMEKAISNATEHTGALRIFQTVNRYQRRR